MILKIHIYTHTQTQSNMRYATVASVKNGGTKLCCLLQIMIVGILKLSLFIFSSFRN